MNKNELIILSVPIFDTQTHQLLIGGVQTYMKDLANLCVSLGYRTSIFQYSKSYTESKSYEIDGVPVVDCPLSGSKQKLYNAIRKEYPNAFIIIGSDQSTIRSKHKKTLQIQHGIAFDIPKEYIKGFWGKYEFLTFLNKFLRCFKNMRRFYQVPNTICVDYNFYNWFRTIGIIKKNNFVRVIPNYASDSISKEFLERKLKSFNGIKKIIFARRFVDYRGTLLFADVASEIIKQYPEIRITFAGTGPLEQYLQNRFKENKNIEITTFNAQDSVKVQSQYDLAIVPTIFSEGTSLSLIEAMAAGCLPIATHVGGMTNIIINQFNGLITYPDKESLYQSIVKAIELSENEHKKMVTAAYNTAVTAFSLEHWKQQWREVLSIWALR